jgi:hypothetical protein
MDSRKLLGLSFTGALLAGCQPGDEEAAQCGDTSLASKPGPPTLVAAQLIDNTLLRLTFSEPLAAVDEVDPASFRLSWTFSGPGYDGYEGYTSYYDPVAALCSATDYCTGEYTEVVELRCAPGDPSSLVLRLENFPTHICNIINQFSNYYGYTSPLLPHFDAMIGTITDLDGEPLASISPAFVSEPEVWLDVEGEFPNYAMRIPIECPQSQ